MLSEHSEKMETVRNLARDVLRARSGTGLRWDGGNHVTKVLGPAQLTSACLKMHRTSPASGVSSPAEH